MTLRHGPEEPADESWPHPSSSYEATPDRNAWVLFVLSLAAVGVGLTLTVGWALTSVFGGLVLAVVWAGVVVVLLGALLVVVWALR